MNEPLAQTEMLLRDGKVMKKVTEQASRDELEKMTDPYALPREEDTDTETDEQRDSADDAPRAKAGAVGSSESEDETSEETAKESRRESPVLSAIARKLARADKAKTLSRLQGLEDGTNIRAFLDVAEVSFMEQGIDPRKWGHELKAYLSMGALAHWLYMHREGMPMDDWQTVKQAFLRRFCNLTPKVMITEMAKNKWKGDPDTYSSRFNQIVERGQAMPRRRLLGLYLANIPREHFVWLTMYGSKRIRTWRDAARELSKTYTEWKGIWTLRNKAKRLIKETLKEGSESEKGDTSSESDIDCEKPSKKRWREEPRRTRPARLEYPRRGVPREPQPEGLCYECQGRGHMGRNCPLRNGVLRRPGETCSRCGGRDHYATQCSSLKEGTRMTGVPPIRSNVREGREIGGGGIRPNGNA